MRLRSLPVCLGTVAAAVAAVVLLAVANWPPLVRSAAFQKVEDSFSFLVVRALAQAAPARPAARGMGLPPAGRTAVFEPAELIRLWQSGRRPPRGVFTVLANTPASYQWFPPGYQRWLLRASTEAAVALGIDAVVDASQADALRAEAGGRGTAAALRRAGICRAVIIDGAHHLPGLALEPELAILPVVEVRGTPYACHVHVRDAVSVPALAAWSAAAGLRTVFCTTPRLWTLAKTKRAMAEILARALAACGRPVAPGETRSLHRLPPRPAGLVLKRSALELYLAKCGIVAAGR